MLTQLPRRKFLAGSVTALSLSTAGCAAEEGAAEEPNNSQQTPSWRDTINTWLDNHESKEQEALNQFNDGSDAYESEDYSRAYMHFQKARKRYDDLNSAVENKADEYEEGTNTREGFQLLVQYYWRMTEASAARENAAFAMPDEPIEAESQLERASDHLDEANRLKENFRNKMNYGTSTSG
ncbi:hypothetical protein B4589_013540 [Halolamina sp. CBA1230]|uniref:hypothetical protein n=1 Tax=Halolamina sp. CBA1230 TaxID=1853690 RepID=UPI0011798A44|nr:hypothetical protein [Halolamina sp. CBA1230]QKY21344.1 hypothetical protein B4589_013540 [Halolamina sp. CBA1230]